MNRDSCILLILAFALLGCKERHASNIDTAYHLLSSNPDSAMEVLSSVNQERLGKSEKARYALVYSAAQDKSGMDVDNDSLLSVAFHYYRNRDTDTLYAKCMYYNGKYFALNAKNELATECYEKSIAASDKQGDKHTLCLALEKLSVLHRETNPRKAVEEARRALIEYSSLKNKSAVNSFYYTLNLADAYLYADSLTEAERTCNEAIVIASDIDDSELLSSAYQDMSLIKARQGSFRSALAFSEASYETTETRDNNKKLNLASAYLDVDSIKECLSVLKRITPSSPVEKYSLLYLRHIASIKENNSNDAVLYADSAYREIEQMYTNALSDKETYYRTLANTIVENRMMEEKADTQKKLYAILITFILALTIFISYSYHQYKERVKVQHEKEALQLEMDKSLHEEEMKHKDLQLEMMRAEAKREMEAKMYEEDLKRKELQLQLQKSEANREMEKRLHEERMKHREIQLSTMRKYILSKINISQKIEELKGNKDKNAKLTDEEWEEIRIFIDNTDDNFVYRLMEKYPELTDDDVRFMMLIRLNMSARAIALIYGICEKSICQKLFVYKSKVRLDKDKKMSLREFIRDF